MTQFQPIVVALVHEGFRPKHIKDNFKIVNDNLGVEEKTISAFHEVCQVKNSKKRRESRDLKDNDRKRQRRGSKTRGHQVASTNQGQNHDLVEEFHKLSEQAYPQNAGEKLLAKGYTKLVLDGNNMMFVTDAIRRLTLAGKRAKAEKLLSAAALAFSQLVGISTEIVFDQTHLPPNNFSSSSSVLQPNLKTNTEEFNTEISKIVANFPAVGVPLIFTNGTSFMVSSARPQFGTTDDKLISWARLNQEATVTTTTTTTTETPVTSSTTAHVHPDTSVSVSNKDTLVVSSDRALAGELCSLGVTLIKPALWFVLFASLVDGEQPQEKGSAFKWFDNWCCSILPDM